MPRLRHTVEQIFAKLRGNGKTEAETQGSERDPSLKPRKNQAPTSTRI